jgi:hypothetical protein
MPGRGLKIEEANASVKEATRRAMRDRDIAAYVRGVKRAKPDLSRMGESTVAITLENTKRWLRKVQETSDSSAIGNFIHYGYELISAIMPNLVATEVCSVQPMTRKVGEVFFMRYNYGTDKGTISSGDTMFGVFQSGQGGERNYTSTTVSGEVLGTGNGGDTYDFKLNMIPAVADGNVSITDGTETFTDAAGSGTLAGSAGGTGTVNYSTGEVHLEFNAAVGGATEISATYTIDFEQNPDNIPELDFQVWSEAVTAKARKIRSKYTLDAMYDLQQAFGRGVDGDVVSACAANIRAEIDAELFELMRSGAYGTVSTWDRNLPMGVSWRDHKYAIIDTIINAQNKVFKQTRRAHGNFIVAGVDVCTVIESLESEFKPSGADPQAGPYIVGHLRGMPVIKNPYYPDKEYVVGHKGSMWLNAGLVYSPYMPLFVTPPVVLDDQVVRRGLGTRYATKMVNNRMYVHGDISGENVPTAAP